MLKPYVPERETLNRYQERVRKQARFLESLGQPLGEGVLDVILAMSEYELRVYEESRDPLEQKKALVREYGLELLDIDHSPSQGLRIQALETLLVERGESIAEIRGLVVSGQDVRAPAPAARPLGSEPGLAPAAPAGVTSLPQSSEPGLEPAAPAGVTSFVIHGTGTKTPVSAAGTVEGQFADVQRQLREMAAEFQHPSCDKPMTNGVSE